MTGVRRFAVGDAAACCAVINACVPTMDGLNEAARQFILEKNTPAQLGEALARLCTLVYVRAGEVIGVGALDGAEIKRVYVLPAAQGQGIGAGLMDALEAEARRRGRQQVVIRSSPAAAAFYRRRGYTQEQTETMTIGPAVFTFVNMAKSMPSSRWR